MNKMFTRVICLILAFLLSVVVFVGCNKSDKNDSSSSSSSDDVTSVAPPSVVIDNTEGYKVADGTTFVAVFTDTKTNITTMKVATETALSAFKEAVTATEGYSYKIVDTNGNEITDDTAIIVDGYKFMLYKNGETTATKTYTISVVTKEKIESTISEVKAEESRYESQMAEVSSKQASNQTSSQTSSYPDTASDDHSIVDISSMAASSTNTSESILNGYTVNIKSNSMISEFWRDKFNEIESKYNMKINVDYVGIWGEVVTIPEAEKEYYGDLILTSPSTAISFAKSGKICDFNNATTLIDDESCFNTNISDGLTFQGKKYALSLTSMGSNPIGVSFNQDMVSLYAPEYDIYKMYKDGTWTADAYAEIIKACSRNLDSDPSTYEVYGMTSNTAVIGNALSSFAGNGKDPSTGYLYPSFITDAGIQSLEWCKDAYNNKYWKYIADIYKAIYFFAEGKAATIVTYMWAVTQAASVADFNIGFVPFPKAGNQNNYVTQTYDSPVFVVPITNKTNIDKIVAFINELATSNDEVENLVVGEYEAVGLDEIGCSVYRWALKNAIPSYDGANGEIISTTVSSRFINSVINPSQINLLPMDYIKNLAIYEMNDYYSDLTGQPKTEEPEIVSW